MSKQKGFGLVGALVIVVVLATVSGAGYYVYSQSQEEDTVNEVSQTAETKDENSDKLSKDTNTKPDLQVVQTRKKIVLRMQVEISNYAANNNGRIPANQSELNEFYKRYLGCTENGDWEESAPICTVDIEDPLSGQPFKLLYADMQAVLDGTKEIPDADSRAVYAAGAYCTEGAVSTKDASSRNFAVWTYVEELSAYCVDNR